MSLVIVGVGDVRVVYFDFGVEVGKDRSWLFASGCF